MFISVWNANFGAGVVVSPPSCCGPVIVLYAVIGTLASDYLLVVMLLVAYLCTRLHIHFLACQRKMVTMNRIQWVLVCHCVLVYWW